MYRDLLHCDVADKPQHTSKRMSIRHKHTTARERDNRQGEGKRMTLRAYTLHTGSMRWLPIHMDSKTNSLWSIAILNKSLMKQRQNQTQNFPTFSYISGRISHNRLSKWNICNGRNGPKLSFTIESK